MYNFLWVTFVSVLTVLEAVVLPVKIALSVAANRRQLRIASMLFRFKGDQ